MAIWINKDEGRAFLKSLPDAAERIYTLGTVYLCPDCGGDFYECWLDAGEDGEAPDKVAAEAAFVAEKIRALVAAGTPVQDDKRLRPMEYGDVAILMSAANNTGPLYRRVLSAHGVPVAAGQGQIAPS